MKFTACKAQKLLSLSILTHDASMENPLHFLAAARQCEINELQRMLRTSSLVRALAELIHALQKERGLSSILLASEGLMGRDALHMQRQTSDQHMATLRTALSQLDVDSLQGGQGARLCSRIAYVLQGLDALAGLRHSVSAFGASVQTSTQAYIHLIADLLNVVFEAADSATYPSISRLLVAMFHFMQGKELAGQERATGAATFSAGVSYTDSQQHWLHLIEAQERCMQVFADCAPEALVQAWQRCSATGSDVTAVERLRRIGCTALDGAQLPRELSPVWFEACTNVMDGMHHIESLLAQALVRDCEVQLDLAQTGLARLPSTMPAAHPQGEAVPEFFTMRSAMPAENHWAPPLQMSVLSVVQEQSQRLQAMRNELDTVRQALTERKTLERAKGLLMTHQKLSESEAHKLLRQTAMSQNRRIIDVAEAVLSMADLLAKPIA